jgi:hypothetical protein
VDLWSPLLAIAFVADAEDTGNRGQDILDAAKDLAAVRDADADAGPAARLLEALQAIREREGELLAPADLLEALRSRPGWDWVKSTRRLASLLNLLGITPREIWNGGQRRWRYVLDVGQLADLQARYGARGEGPEDSPDAVAGNPSSAPETGAIR